MQEQKKIYNFDQSLRNELENHQSQVIKMFKRYSQQLEMELKQKDILLQSQKQKYTFQIEQYKNRYQRQLQYETQNNKLLLEYERENFTTLLQQERKKTQLMKQLIHRNMQKERQTFKEQMRRQSYYVREECISFIKQNLRILLKEQIQNICLTIRQEPESQKLEKVITYFEKGLQKIKDQMGTQLLISGEIQKYSIKDSSLEQHVKNSMQSGKIFLGSKQQQETEYFKKETKQNENQVENWSGFGKISDEMSNIESKQVTQISISKQLIENKQEESRDQFVQNKQEESKLEQTISTNQIPNIKKQDVIQQKGGSKKKRKKKLAYY